MERIDPLPSPEARVPVEQLEGGVQDVVWGELLGQLIAALGKAKALLVSAFEIHEAQPEPEETQRSVAAGGDAIDEREFLSRQIHGTHIVALGDREPAQ